MKPSLRMLVISLAYPPCSIGGYEVMCAQVCEWLRRRGHNVQVLTSVPLAVPAPGEGVWQAGSISVRRTLSSYWDGWDCLYPPFREALAMEQANQAQLQGMLAEYRPDVVSFWHMGAMSLGLITTTLRLDYPVVFVIGDDWLCYGGWADAWLRRFSYHPQRVQAIERLTSLPTRLPVWDRQGCFALSATPPGGVPRGSGMAFSPLRHHPSRRIASRVSSACSLTRSPLEMAPALAGTGDGGKGR